MQDTTQTENRASPRSRVLKSGTILVGSRPSVISCMVRNLSKTGAKLICGDQISVPNSFRLSVGGEAEPRMARVRWRKGNEIGVEFVTGPAGG